MSSEEDSLEVSEEIKRLVCDIAAKNNIKETCQIKYSKGSQAGDGYATKTYAVDIADGESTLDLFLKCAFKIEGNELHAYSVYICETNFYKTIYPVYTAFWENKGVKEGFRNVPLCYGFDETRGSEILALENLRKKGYTMFDRSKLMNDEHLKLVLRSFAKFHAISFALKDQQKDLHDEFCDRCPNILVDVLPQMFSGFVKEFVGKLDAVEDKNLFDKCDNLATKVYDQIRNLDELLTDYSILSKGDCWVNNMMMLYENDNREHPIDIMLIDWQCMIRASPIHDIQGLFYAVASQETLDNYKNYLEVYYEELSKGIKELGSDPDVLYPRSVFEKEWIDYGLFGLGVALTVIKVMLLDSSSAPSIENDEVGDDVTNMFSNATCDEKELMIRSKRLVQHMIDIGVV